MSTPDELQDKLWKALESDHTLMLGVPEAEYGHLRPMTALLDGRHSPLWFFARRPNALIDMADGQRTAVASFVDKGHDLFACLSGTLHVHDGPSVIERLWRPSFASWFEGKDDPRLVLLRFDATHAEIWQGGNTLLDGIKTLLGKIDPDRLHADEHASVDLR